MDKILKPDRLDLDPSTNEGISTSSAKYRHWKATFENFFTILGDHANTDEKRFQILINYVSPEIYTDISSSTSYTTAIDTLKKLFVKEKNETFARYCLLNRIQKEGESLDQYMIALETLAKACNFDAVTAAQHRQQSIKTAFISGLRSNQIRQRLLEETKDLSETYESALTLESAMVNSEKYLQTHSPFSPVDAATQDSPDEKAVAASLYNNNVNHNPRKQVHSDIKSCTFCGYDIHPRKSYPARDSSCNSCNKLGHWSRVCQSSGRSLGNSSKYKTSRGVANNNNMYCMLIP